MRKTADGSWQKKGTFSGSGAFVSIVLNKDVWLEKLVHGAVTESNMLRHSSISVDRKRISLWFRTNSDEEISSESRPCFNAFSDSTAAFQTVASGPENSNPGYRPHAGLNHSHYGALPCDRIEYRSPCLVNK